MLIEASKEASDGLKTRLMGLLPRERNTSLTSKFEAHGIPRADRCKFRGVPSATKGSRTEGHPAYKREFRRSLIFPMTSLRLDEQCVTWGSYPI